MGKFKHGEVGTRIYRIWSNMRNRCNCPTTTNYALWGGKGITVCSEWDDFLTFKKWALASGYTDEMSIDRIDNSGNYNPGNCRWATSKEQNNNRKSNIVLTVHGVTKTMAQWCETSGIKYGTMHSWYQRGKSIEYIESRIEEELSHGDLSFL